VLKLNLKKSWINDAVKNMYRTTSEININHGAISNIHYIMELDMLLAIADNPYLIDLRNGAYFRAPRIAERARMNIKVLFKFKKYFLN
jgi:Cu/Ag efflux protein CusF